MPQAWLFLGAPRRSPALPGARQEPRGGTRSERRTGAYNLVLAAKPFQLRVPTRRPTSDPTTAPSRASVMGPACDVSGRDAAPPTAQRAYCAQKAFLTCPKTVAAMCLRVPSSPMWSLSSSRTLRDEGLAHNHMNIGRSLFRFL